MGIKKIIPMLIVLLFIFSTKALHLEEGTKNIVEKYVGNLKELSEAKVKTKKEKEVYKNKFDEIIRDFKYLSEIITGDLEKFWNGQDYGNLDDGQAPSVGKYIAMIIKKEWKNPERIVFVGSYIVTLSSMFSENDYLTASWKVFNKIVVQLELESTIDLTSAGLGSIKKMHEEVKIYSDKTKRLSLSKLSELGNNLIRKNSILLLNNIGNLHDEVETLKKRIPKKVIPKTGFWNRLENFIKEKDAWFIIGLIAILFIAILLSNIYIRRHLRVKIPPSSDGEEPNVKKNRYVNDVVLRLSTEIADLKKLKESYVNLKVQIEEIGKKIENPEVDYESFSRSIKDDIDTKFEDLKRDLKPSNWEKIGDQLSDILEKMGISEGPEQVENTIVTTERQILLKIWNLESFKEEKAQLYQIAEKMKEKQDFFEKCYDLANQIDFNEELSSYYDNILRPLRNYQDKLTQFLDIKNVLGKKDIFEVKQKIYFLVMLQQLNQGPELLKFSLKKWFEEEFLDFSDQFFRRYQKDEFSDRLSEEMENANRTIRDILSSFNIEPIPIVLGQTPFNSQVHLGQSNVSDSSMIDGVIAEVVKNGFRIKQGEILIKPEVFVNRL